MGPSTNTHNNMENTSTSNKSVAEKFQKIQIIVTRVTTLVTATAGARTPGLSNLKRSCYSLPLRYHDLHNRKAEAIK